MGNLNNQTWDELWNSPEAEKVRAKVRCCDRDCWMIGSVSPAMHKYIWKPATWVLVHKFKALFTKHPYSMYELTPDLILKRSRRSKVKYYAKVLWFNRKKITWERIVFNVKGMLNYKK